MRRFGMLCVVAVLLLASSCCAFDSAMRQVSERDHLGINPIPVPTPQEDEPSGGVLDYFGNRFRDLFDVVTLKLGWGTDRSIGLQLRLCYPIQIGAGIFEGYVLAIDHGCVGVMKEAELEGGISVFYVGYIARKIVSQSGEAERRNIFFGDVGEKGELSLEATKMYDDENAGWLTSTVQAQLPYLPKVEITINWGEIPDFFLSIFGLGIDGLRVPPAFHKQDGPDGEKGERIPAPSIFWHGQEKYEKYD